MSAVSPWLWEQSTSFWLSITNISEEKFLRSYTFLISCFVGEKKKLKLHGLLKDVLNLQICMKLKTKSLCTLHFSLSSVTLVEVALTFTAVQAKNPGSAGCSSALVLTACVATSAFCAEAWSVGQWTTGVGYYYIDCSYASLWVLKSLWRDNRGCFCITSNKRLLTWVCWLPEMLSLGRALYGGAQS